MRVSWGILMIFDKITEAEFVDSIICTLFTLLGSTFTLFWADLYLSGGSPLTSSQKTTYFSIISITHMLISLINLMIHLILGLSGDYNHMEKYQGFILANTLVALFVSLMLLGSGIFISRFVQILHFGTIGRKISGKVLCISSILAFALSMKSVFPIFLKMMQVAENW